MYEQFRNSDIHVWATNECDSGCRLVLKLCSMMHAQLKNAMNINCGPLSCVIKLSQLPDSGATHLRAEKTRDRNNSWLLPFHRLSANIIIWSVWRVLFCIHESRSCCRSISSVMDRDRKDAVALGETNLSIFGNIWLCIIITCRAFPSLFCSPSERLTE